MAGISDLCAGSGSPEKAKVLFLGSPDFRPEGLMNQVSSLNFEHVSPVRLKGPEISRRTASAAAEEANLLALMRRWFFARKPDAGFFLTEFPATLLQAKVFDEWLEARDETLNVVMAGPGANESVLQHYRTLGLLHEASSLPAAGQPADGSSVASAKEERP